MCTMLLIILKYMQNEYKLTVQGTSYLHFLNKKRLNNKFYYKYNYFPLNFFCVYV